MALSRRKKMLIGVGGLLALLALLSRTEKGKAAVKASTKAVREAGKKVFGSTEKVLATLDPAFEGLVRQFLAEADAAGLDIVLTSGRRTIAEQEALYAKGRTAGGSKVTNAGPGDSAHNYGLAIDFAFANALGVATFPPFEDPRWAQAAAIGKRLGMEWGGDWKSFKDGPHLELPAWKQARADWKAGKIQVA
jgi:peptidoglycan L-alanyl-D-glutamate endopeptidase CwlK